jgi:hypothetical protein
MALDGATSSAAVGFALGCFFGTVTFGSRRTARASLSKFSPAFGPSWYSCFILAISLSVGLDNNS